MFRIHLALVIPIQMELQQKIYGELFYSHFGAIELGISQLLGQPLGLEHFQQALQIPEIHLDDAAFLCMHERVAITQGGENEWKNFHPDQI